MNSVSSKYVFLEATSIQVLLSLYSIEFGFCCTCDCMVVCGLLNNGLNLSNTNQIYNEIGKVQVPFSSIMYYERN